MNKVVLLIAVILISACTSNLASKENSITAFKPDLAQDKVQQRNSFIGAWKSSQPTKNGGHRETLIERHPDSRYIVRFSIFDDTGVLTKEQKEFGYWGVSGGVYFTMYRGQITDDKLLESDPTDAYNYDAYQIISTSADSLVYKSLSSGNQYTYTRVK